jgi:hypothetical protein
LSIAASAHHARSIRDMDVGLALIADRLLHSAGQDFIDSRLIRQSFLLAALRSELNTVASKRITMSFLHSSPAPLQSSL